MASARNIKVDLLVTFYVRLMLPHARQHATHANLPDLAGSGFRRWDETLTFPELLQADKGLGALFPRRDVTLALVGLQVDSQPDRRGLEVH